MISALGHITLKQWRGHALRASLTALGIVLGVASFYSICVANAAVVESLRQTVERIAGKATLQVTAGEGGLAESVLDRIRKTQGVALAEPIIEVVAQTPFGDDGNLLILGVDIASNQQLRGYEIDKEHAELSDELEFIAQPDSLLLSRPFAKRHQLGIGNRLRLTVPNGRQDFTIRGLFTPTGLAEVYGGNLAIMDVYAAQVIFDRVGKFDRVDLMNTPGTDVEGVRGRLLTELPAGLEVERPATRGQQLENTVAVIRFGLLVTSVVALVVAIYIILNSFTISVSQRWKELGILRALGVTQSAVTGMFLAEAVVMGLLGAILGVVAGQYLAIGAQRMVGAVVASTYGVITASVGTHFRVNYALAAGALGISAAVLGAWLPARAAARLDPIRALHNVEARSGGAGPGWRHAGTGLALLICGSGLIMFSPPRIGTSGHLAYGALLFLGVALLLPKLVQVVGRGLRPVMDRLAGVDGAIAVDAMTRSPRRSAAAVGALVIGTAFVFSTQATIDAHRLLMHRWMDQMITSDLLVAASRDARSIRAHFSEKLGQQLAAIPGVRNLESVRYTSVAYMGHQVMLVATDMSLLLKRANAAIDVEQSEAVRQQLVDGEGVLVSQNFAERWRVTRGAVLTLNAPLGRVAMPVLGVVADYRSEKGSIFMSRSTYKRYWSDSAIDFFNINLDDDADPAAGKNRVERLVGQTGSGVVFTNYEYRRWIDRQVGRFFLMNEMQIIIAVVVALLGIINTLFISVVERRREIGVMRALGGLSSQIQKQVLLEGGAIAFIGVIIGAAVSAVTTLFVSRTATAAATGFVLPYVFPWRLALACIPIVMLTAILAGWWPAHNAARGNVAEAIAYE